MNASVVLYEDIRKMLVAATQKVYASINVAMIQAYWRIGRRIVEEEQAGEKRAEYGTALIEYLAQRLSAEFGKGYSKSNLFYFKQFYLTFPDENFLHALRGKLSWTHYRSIMRVQNPNARNYYIREAADNNWSTRQLDRNINTLYYERLLSTQTPNTATDRPAVEKASPKDLIKDPYVLEFLDIPHPKQFSENQLEAAIISHLQEFLLEMGKGFAFVGRQYHIKTDTKHFYVDLVFYNYILKCFVLIDLKLNELTHQDIGQMDMYVRMFGSLHASESDNPTIGIVLCTAKDQTLVKYSILEENKHLFASK
jgi:predicted nuclease of restriction endonuclease-like (RecB) superfamily